jgi:aminodeoxyfutalosine synthase
MVKTNFNEIAEKIEKSVRLSKDDALTLMDSNDLISIGQLANKVREKSGNYPT